MCIKCIKEVFLDDKESYPQFINIIFYIYRQTINQVIQQ